MNPPRRLLRVVVNTGWILLALAFALWLMTRD